MSQDLKSQEVRIDDDWIEKEDHESARALLRNLREKSDPVTQAVCDNMIADMLKPPDIRSSANRLWDKARRFVRDGVRDFSGSLAKAAGPLQKWLPNRGRRSLSTKANASVSSETSEDTRHLWKERDELPATQDLLPNESPGWDPGEPLLQTFLRDARDYKSYCVPDFDWLQEDTKLLHKNLLRSMVDGTYYVS
jgi:hypothetical protein